MLLIVHIFFFQRYTPLLSLTLKFDFNSVNEHLFLHICPRFESTETVS